MGKICLVIPCYNEEKRLPTEEFTAFLKKTDDVFLCFVNDGSTDNTIGLLQKIHDQFPDKTTIISENKNCGKAEAVRHGILDCLDNSDFDYYGYFDADLSTPLEECYYLKNQLNETVEFAFGSRIMKVGSVIERSAKRHFAGRIIATFISQILKLNVYDTQCGSKLFTKEFGRNFFQEPFISKWLFDVEIFARMINKYSRKIALTKMVETPLNQWINKEGSKVRPTYFFKLWIDLYRIRKKYFRS